LLRLVDDPHSATADFAYDPEIAQDSGSEIFAWRLALSRPELASTEALHEFDGMKDLADLLRAFGVSGFILTDRSRRPAAAVLGILLGQEVEKVSFAGGIGHAPPLDGLQPTRAPQKYVFIAYHFTEGSTSVRRVSCIGGG
jgi:hypothetical protein